MQFHRNEIEDAVAVQVENFGNVGVGIPKIMGKQEDTSYSSKTKYRRSLIRQSLASQKTLSSMQQKVNMMHLSWADGAFQY